MMPATGYNTDPSRWGGKEKHGHAARKANIEWPDLTHIRTGRWVVRHRGGAGLFGRRGRPQNISGVFSACQTPDCGSSS